MKKLVSILSAVIVLLGLSLTGCKKEPEPSTGDALFEYQTDGLTVHFFNKSTIEDPKAFIWDFGDGETSNEENPTHTYAKKGEYTVKLTVVDQADVEHSVSTKIKVDKASPVKLDDSSLDDWANVSDFVITPDSGGAIVQVKLDYDVNYIYVYVKAQTNDTVIHGIFFDTDLDTNTGFISHYWPLMGSDILAQAKPDDGQDGDWGVYQFAGNPGEHGWNWAQVQETDIQIIGTYKRTGDVVEYEIGYSREKIPGLDGDKLMVAVYLSNTAWAEIGVAPDPATEQNPDVAGYVMNLNLAGK